jgi:transcriptional regulator with XRE-family HTH domain
LTAQILATNLSGMVSSTETLALAEAIREARRTRGWSQTKLAAELGTSESGVRGWEAGHHQPSLRQLVKLCRLFDWPLPWPNGDTGTYLRSLSTRSGLVRLGSDIPPTPASSDVSATPPIPSADPERKNGIEADERGRSGPPGVPKAGGEPRSEDELRCVRRAGGVVPTPRRARPVARDGGHVSELRRPSRGTGRQGSGKPSKPPGSTPHRTGSAGRSAPTPPDAPTRRCGVSSWATRTCRSGRATLAPIDRP